MVAVARKLNGLGWTLRSGGAEGADTAFEAGAGSAIEIYRPRGDQRKPHHQALYADSLWTEAMQAAASVHPAWGRCSDFAKALHARNAFQILGADLRTPSRFVVCWTPDGAKTDHDCTHQTGGTGTAIRLADRAAIDVFNLRCPEDAERIHRWLIAA
jgi:hypothetical protein